MSVKHIRFEISCIKFVLIAQCPLFPLSYLFYILSHKSTITLMGTRLSFTVMPTPKILRTGMYREVLVPLMME